MGRMARSCLKFWKAIQPFSSNFIRSKCGGWSANAAGKSPLMRRRRPTSCYLDLLSMMSPLVHAKSNCDSSSVLTWRPPHLLFPSTTPFGVDGRLSLCNAILLAHHSLTAAPEWSCRSVRTIIFIQKRLYTGLYSAYIHVGLFNCFCRRRYCDIED